MAKRLQRTPQESQSLVSLNLNNADNIDWEFEYKRLLAAYRLLEAENTINKNGRKTAEGETAMFRKWSRRLLIWIDEYFEIYPDDYHIDDNSEIEMRKSAEWKKRFINFLRRKRSWLALPDYE